MNRQRHEQVGALFAKARRLPAPDRRALLEEACRGDPALRREVESLLEAREGTGGNEGGGANRGEDDIAGLRGSLERVAAEVADAGRPLPERIGRYRIVRVMGEGGMGTVYEAEQDDPRRRVALKVIRPGMVGRRLVQRFRHEAQVLGHLRHPGIAQIYEAGAEDRGEGTQPYFALELVTGRPIIEYAAACSLGVRDRLELVALICEALHHAHQKGVIHRDLKPGNILIDEGSGPATGRGLPQPKILDFGVARATGADMQTVTVQTATGELIGTIPYMSPEQVAGDPGEVDVRSDLYAVGVIAYELLAGRLPYPVQDRPIYEAVRIIREDEPSRLSSVSRVFRGDIETIVGKALEKDRTRRYQSAAELAADIRRYLREEPIVARPASTFYQLRKFARRNRMLVGAVAVVFATMLAATVFSTMQMRAAVRARDAAETERAAALGQARRATLAAAQAALDADDPIAARQLLESIDSDQRSWEWQHVFAGLDRSIALVVPTAVAAAGLDTQASEVVTLSRSGELQRWDPFLGERIRHERLDTGRVDHAVFSEDATRLVTAGGPQHRRVGTWSTPPSGPAVCVAEAILDDPVAALAISGDGTLTAVVTSTEVVTWDAGVARRSWRHGLAPRSVNLSEDGARLALLSQDGGRASFHAFDAGTGTPVNTSGHGRDLVSLAVSPDGALVATGELDNVIRIRDSRDGRVLHRLRGHTDLPVAVGFSPDGRRIVSGSLDQTVRVWSLEARDALQVFSGHAAAVRDVRFSVDGSRVLSVDDGGAVRIWSTLPGEGRSVLRGHLSAVGAVSFRPGGRYLMSLAADHAIRLWDVASGEPLDAIQLTPDTVGPLAVSPDGRLAATGHRAMVMLRQTSALSEGSELDGGLGEVTALDFDPNGERLAAVDARGQVLVWDVATRELLSRTTSAPSPAGALAFSADGRLLATAHGATVRVRDAASGEEVYAITGGGPTAGAIAYSADGRHLATGWSDGVVRLHDARTGANRAELDAHTSDVTSVVFSPDGSRLASGALDTTIWIWDVAAARPLVQLRGHDRGVLSLSFAPDGSTLASGAADGTVRLWDTEPMRRRWTAAARLRALSDQVRPLVDRLFETRAEAAWVSQSLRADPTLSEPLRAAALRLAMTPPLPAPGPRCDPFDGFALEFDGGGSHVMLGTSEDLGLTDRFTIEAWINPIESPPETDGTQVEFTVWLPSWQTLFNKEGEYQMARGPGGTLFWVVAGPAGWVPWTSLRYAAPAWQWTHVALVRDGRTIRAHVNGRVVQELPGPREIGDHHPEMNELRLGGRQHTELGFRGRMDEVRIWKVARSPQEIAAAMRRACRGDEPGLVGCWRLDEGRGDVAHDLTGRHHGVVVDAAWVSTRTCDPRDASTP